MTRSRFVRRSWPALIFAVFLTACGGSTGTPAVDSQQLQQRLDQFVETLTRPEPDSDFTAKAEGKATVESKDDGTVIGTLPKITFTGKEGNTAVLDPISIRFTNGGDGRTNFEATLPSAMTVKGKDGKVEGEVKIGSQTLKGVWVEKLQTVDDLDMRLSNISITSPTEPGSGKVDQIAFKGKLEPKGSGVYDGKYEFTMKGFNADDPSEKTVMKMASIGVSATMTGAKMEAMAQAAKEAGYTLANPELYKVWTGGPIDPKIIAFMKRIPEFMGTVNYVYSLDGIEVVQDGKTEFTMKKTSMGFGASPDGKGTTKISMSMGVGGMTAGADEPMLPPEAEIQDATIEIDASGIPGQKLWDIYVDALPQIQAAAAQAAADTATEGDPTTAGTVAMEQVSGELSGKFMEVLTAAKLAIALNKFDLMTPTAKMTGKGAATYLPAEAIMPEGKITLRFSGIDALARAMEKRGMQDDMAQQIMGVVAGVRAMGKPDPASPQGDRAYIIEIQFTKDGQVLANGQDMLGMQ